MNIQENELARETEAPTEPQPASYERYVPLLVWTLVVATLLLISVKIIGYGFLPGGDARRHVAKAFTEKPYTEILVMRPEYSMDHSPGWEWLLHRLHRTAGLDIDGLMSFSLIGLMLCIFLIPLPWLRRPEAWLAALLAQMVAIPELMTRFTQARPYLITEAILVGILFGWSKTDSKKPSWLKIGLTSVGFMLSVWIHGLWYMWVLLLGAFFLARAWRAGLWLTGCWLAGTIAGAILTGKPVEFLKQAVLIAHSISREHLPEWMLVGELRPMYGEFATLALLAIVVLWRRQQNKGEPVFARLPLVWMIGICWILGFKADRFWADWGIAAVLVWLTIQFQEGMKISWVSASWQRLMACGLIALPLFLHATNDLDRRYTHNLNEVFLDGSDPGLQGWLPESKGIFYASDMGFFYNTFYKNPQADWRYIVGLEPALMPDEDLKVYRSIQWNQGALKAYEPWIEKMRPADRLIISSAGQPNLPQLEWHNAVGYMWIGRLPRH